MPENEKQMAPVVPVLHWSETTFPAVASTTVNFTDEDGLPNENTIAHMIDLTADVGAFQIQHIDRIRLQSGAGQWDIDMVNYRRWLARFTKGRILAATDTRFPLIYHFPDFDMNAVKYSSQLAPGSYQVSLVLGAGVPVNSAFQVAARQVRGVARRFSPVLQSSTFTLAATGPNQRIPLEIDGFMRGVSVPVPAAVTRLQLWNKAAIGEAYRDGTPGQVIEDETYEAQRPGVADLVVTDGIFCNLDPDGDILGLAPGTSALAKLLVDQTAGAVSFEVGKYGVVPV
jgi:hypothetical protein